MNELWAVVVAGWAAGWHLGGSLWIPLGSALALIVASSGGGRRALGASLALCLGGLAAQLALALSLQVGLDLPARLLGHPVVTWGASLLVMVPGLLLAWAALAALRRGGRPAGLWLVAVPLLQGFGIFLLASSSARLYVVILSGARGDAVALAVCTVSIALGILLGPTIPLGYLGSVLLGRARGSRAGAFRRALLLVGAMLAGLTLALAL